MVSDRAGQLAHRFPLEGTDAFNVELIDYR
jgi:hypothetical protein